MSKSPKVQQSESASGEPQALLEFEVRGSPEPGLLRELLLLLLDAQVRALGERPDDRLGTAATLARIARQFAVEEPLPLFVRAVEVIVGEPWSRSRRFVMCFCAM